MPTSVPSVRAAVFGGRSRCPPCVRICSQKKRMSSTGRLTDLREVQRRARLHRFLRPAGGPARGDGAVPGNSIWTQRALSRFGAPESRSDFQAINLGDFPGVSICPCPGVSISLAFRFFKCFVTGADRSFNSISASSWAAPNRTFIFINASAAVPNSTFVFPTLRAVRRRRHRQTKVSFRSSTADLRWIDPP